MIMGMFKCRLFLAVAAAISMTLPVAVHAELDVSDWTDAARARIQAAESLEQQASELMDRAAALKDKDFLYESERKSNYKKAGQAEMKAGRLCLAASRNFLRAADNWKQAEELASNDEQERGPSVTVIRKRIEDVVGKATGAFMAAAESFDAAAASFAVDKGSEESLAKKAAKKAEEARNRAFELKSN